MSTNTSIGPEGARGGNDDPGNADGCGNKTLGDKSTQQPPAGAGQASGEAGAQAPARDTGRGETLDR
jgi:hypothetical protein